VTGVQTCALPISKTPKPQNPICVNGIEIKVSLTWVFADQAKKVVRRIS